MARGAGVVPVVGDGADRELDRALVKTPSLVGGGSGGRGGAGVRLLERSNAAACDAPDWAAAAEEAPVLPVALLRAWLLAPSDGCLSFAPNSSSASLEFGLGEGAGLGDPG